MTKSIISKTIYRTHSIPALAIAPNGSIIKTTIKHKVAPIGCLVAVKDGDKIKIGWSKYSSFDRRITSGLEHKKVNEDGSPTVSNSVRFNKKFGREIAIRRAYGQFGEIEIKPAKAFPIGTNGDALVIKTFPAVMYPVDDVPIPSELAKFMSYFKSRAAKYFQVDEKAIQHVK